jgi:hypothetical protein
MSTEQITQDREAWLRRAADQFRTMIEQVSGIQVPDFRVAMGYGAHRFERYVPAITYPRTDDEKGLNQVYISPKLSDTMDVLLALLHSMIHVALESKGAEGWEGHGSAFAEHSMRLGFDGDAKAIPSPGLAAEMITIAAALGEFPHGALKAARTPVEKSAETQALVTAGAPPVTSGMKSEKNRWISYYCDKHDGAVRMVASKAARCAMVCTEFDGESGQMCGKPLHRR